MSAVPSELHLKARVLEATGLAVGRSGRPVLSDITLHVEAGERIALVGGNGSGKTTLLRAFAGLDAPCSGALRWSGGPLPSGPARPRAVGVLFQTEAASPFTVRELVTLGLGLDHPPRAADRKRVEAALVQGGLVHLAERRVGALSGGELQRVFWARACVASPKLLLLDEPTNHLDPRQKAELLATLEGLRGEAAVVLATHDLALAATCDRVALLAEGRLLALGPPNEVLTPAGLERGLGVRVRRVEDPLGGPPFFRAAPARALEVFP